MIATLYLPQQPEKNIFIDELGILDQSTGLVNVSAQVSALLGCLPELVDVLASGSGYVAYSVFDSEEEINHAAMAAVSEASGVTFDAEDDDTTLRGAILLVLA